jgi:hypothetical protein
MAAPKGNNYNKKLKDKATKDKVYKHYCEWIASGKSHKSWWYDKDGLQLTWESIETYIKEDNDLDPKHKEMAVAMSFKIWEQLGYDMMVNKIEKCQPAIYQMMMRNKFGWDKLEQNKEENKGAFNNYYKNKVE